MSQHEQPTGPHVREMAMLMRMLLKYVPEDKQAHRLAMHYLQKYDLTGQPLRALSPEAPASMKEE